MKVRDYKESYLPFIVTAFLEAWRFEILDRTNADKIKTILQKQFPSKEVVVDINWHYSTLLVKVGEFRFRI